MFGQASFNSDQIDIERMLVEKYVPNKIEIDNLQAIKEIMFYSGWTFKTILAPFVNPDFLGPGYKILWPTCANINLIRDVPFWEIPVCILQGDKDYYTDTFLAKAYFDSIQPPEKKWYLFQNSGHAPNWEQLGKYRSIIENDVLK